MKNNKGITMTSLIVTIIVMVILAGIALLFSVGDSGVISRAEKTKLLEDLKLYKEEFELYKANNQIENLGELGIINDTWEFLEVKRYVSSMKSNYDGILVIDGGELAFVDTGDNDEEVEVARTAGLKIVSENVIITVEIEGEGSVENLPPDGIINSQRGSPISLKAIAGQKQVEDESIEYIFSGWYKNGELVEKESEYKFRVEGNTDLVVRFKTDASLIYYLENGEEKVLVDSTTNLSTYASSGIDKNKITSLEIGKKCISIAKEAFSGCENLKTVTAYTTNVLTLGNSAFSGCKSLTQARFYKVKMGKENSNGSQFLNCNNLTYLQLGEIGSGAIDIDAYNVIANTTHKDLIVDVYLDNTSQRLGAMHTTNSTVNYYNAEGKLIDVSWGLRYSGDKSLETIEIPDVTSEIRGSAFKDCTNLKLTKLPSNIIKISPSAFENCTNVKITEIPSTCTTIGEKAFFNTGITNITADTTNVLTLGNSAFSGCINLEEARFYKVKMGKQNGNGSQFLNCNNLTYLQLGKIGSGAIDIDAYSVIANTTNKDLIVDVYLDNTSQRLNSMHTTNGTINYYNIEGTLIDVSWGLRYSGDTSLETIEIPDVTSEIRASAFKDCTNLKLTKLPSNIKKISDNAFENCTNITITEIPSTCTTIGVKAFANTGITNITADTTGVLTLGNSAFSGCINLDEARFYKVKMGKQNGNGSQFANCNNLTYLQLGKIGSGAIDIDAYSVIANTTNKDLIVDVYLDNTSQRLGAMHTTSATVNYYDAEGKFIEMIVGSKK